MRFWDASAIIPLLFDESWSDQIHLLLREDEAMVVWWGARIECASALRRREREEALSSADAREALDLLNVLAQSWTEILPVEAVRTAAERALAVHALRAADSLQLAAAMSWRQDPTQRKALVCLDERLRDAAAREGFILLPGSADFS